MATIAAVVASQALISGSFTIFSEAMNLHFWPRQRIKYPTDERGNCISRLSTSVYVLCVAVILHFRSSSNMEAAYGLAITDNADDYTASRSYLSHSARLRWMMAPGQWLLHSLRGYLLCSQPFQVLQWRMGDYAPCCVICLVMYVWYNADKIRGLYVERRDVRLL